MRYEGLCKEKRPSLGRAFGSHGTVCSTESHDFPAALILWAPRTGRALKRVWNHAARHLLQAQLAFRMMTQAFPVVSPFMSFVLNALFHWHILFYFTGLSKVVAPLLINAPLTLSNVFSMASTFPVESSACISCMVMAAVSWLPVRPCRLTARPVPPYALSSSERRLDAFSSRTRIFSGSSVERAGPVLASECSGSTMVGLGADNSKMLGC